MGNKRFIIFAMNEGSLPSFSVFRFKNSPFFLAKRAIKNIRRRLYRLRSITPDPALRTEASAVIRQHTEAHAPLFERAERLRARAERLEREGTPSDSARNRAERANREATAELADLRVWFGDDVNQNERLLAFDLEVELLYPALKPLDAGT